MHIAFSTIFVIMRYLHTLSYSLKLSYLRSVAYLLGHISLLVLMIEGAR